VVLTAESHPSGTDRCAEAAKKSPKNFVMNVQGDEPFVNCEDLHNLASAFELCERGFDMATLVYRRNDKTGAEDPNVVKAVVDRYGKALYFSRAVIPFPREKSSDAVDWYQHIGVYAFRQDSLQKFVSLDVSPYEQIEKLEQLRALENGMSILVQEAKSAAHGIDTPEDLEAARARFK
jgi:3-deoxy-manno-octulosonate cytidylyltransferase (CMP-KDO synthetase)